MRFLRHQRTLVETAEDQFQLPGIGIDVTDRENAGHAALEGRGLHLHQIVVERDAPIANRTELHGEAEERQHGVAGNLRYRIVVTLDGGGRELAVVALKTRDLTNPEIDLPSRHQRTHLLDAV